jgi:hypothetical protein
MREITLHEIEGKDSFLQQSPKIELEQVPETSTWILPVVGRSAAGFLVMGVKDRPAEARPGIDWPNSVELGRHMLKANSSTPQLLEQLHARTGISRNPFGNKDYHITKTEEIYRLYGWDGGALDRGVFYTIQEQLPRWKVKAVPDDTTSQLVFIPYTLEELEPLREAIRRAEELKDRYEEARKQKLKDPSIDLDEIFPYYLPVPPIRARVVLGYKEGPATKKRWTTLDYFPDIPIHYWWALERTFITKRAYRIIKDFTKQAIAGTVEGGARKRSRFFIRITTAIPKTGAAKCSASSRSFMSEPYDPLSLEKLRISEEDMATIRMSKDGASKPVSRYGRHPRIKFYKFPASVLNAIVEQNVDRIVLIILTKHL